MPHLPAQNNSSEYYITSVKRTEYVGDDQANGVLPPYPIVILDEGIQAPKFIVTKGNGVNIYTMNVNWNTVQDLDDRVSAFDDGDTTEWVIVFRRNERAYTVQKKAENHLAWTAPGSELNRMQILLEPLTRLGPAQLFKFDRMPPPPPENNSSEYYITSVQYGRSLGDDQVNGGVLPPYPIVILDPGVQAPRFTVTKGNEVNTYTIKVNSNMVHDLDDRVVSYCDESTTEWVIIFRRHQRAYTVEKKAEKRLAWTAPELGPDQPTNPLQILLKPLICTASIPPQFLPSQLFKFELVKA